MKMNEQKNKGKKEYENYDAVVADACLHFW